jgi:hypothetical protein
MHDGRRDGVAIGVDDGHAGTLGQEGFAQGQAETACPTGDDGHPIAEPQVWAAARED